MSFTATQQGVVAKQASENKITKYQELKKNRVFFIIIIICKAPQCRSFRLFRGAGGTCKLAISSIEEASFLSLDLNTERVSQLMT